MLALAGVSLVIARCSLEEDFLRDPGTRIAFSVDTLSFDTVFASLGSATRSLKIYNPHDRPLSLASVRVESAAGGRFRINVDGISGEEVRDVYVPPNDSIYVFAEVTVDPDADLSVSPYVIEARLVVRAVDEEQSALLVAFGQNANYLPLDRRRGRFSLLTCELGTERLDDPRPYVLYGSLIVDSCTLVLPEGCRLYVHGGIVAGEFAGDSLVYNDGLLLFAGLGRLLVEGTAERPVLIASARREEPFVQRAGQYSGIRLLAGTGPHVVEHARIRNGSLGIFVDSAARLRIADTELSYISSNGIVAYAGEVDADNVAIHSTGAAAFEALKGGRYTLDYCTLVNFGGRSPAVQLGVGAVINGDQVVVGPLDARIRNSVIYSTSRDALTLPDADRPDLRRFSIANTVLRVDQTRRDVPDFLDNCVDCVFARPEDALFFKPAVDSFQLDTASIALARAQPLPDLTTDLLGRSRDASTPDAGAYEFVPE